MNENITTNDVKLKNSVRIVTAAALFDGHDASINVMRRILQDFGAEVIHLGHNRSVKDVVKTVLQEGAQGVCVSSYQGGHMEYFKYLKDLLVEAGAGHVKIFGGGGGVIVFEEKQELERYGIDQIFHPEDGRRLGLEGMIKMIVEACDFDSSKVLKLPLSNKKIFLDDPIPSHQLGQALCQIELGKKAELHEFGLLDFENSKIKTPVLGITGTGGAGKSSLIDELAQRILNNYKDKKIAILCVDPSKRKTGGGLLGDRIRMNSLSRNRIFMRSLASRGSGREISGSLQAMVNFCKGLDFDLIIAETSGIGQGNLAITEIADSSLYVMTSDFGAQSQLEKIDMIDFANFIAVNKADRRGALDAVRDVAKQYKRSRKMFDATNDKLDEQLPVFLTQAAQFNDKGVNKLFTSVVSWLSEADLTWKLSDQQKSQLLGAEEHMIVPADRQNYLSEIVSSVRRYKAKTTELLPEARKLASLEALKNDLDPQKYQSLKTQAESKFQSGDLDQLKSFESLQKNYSAPELKYKVRDKEIRLPLVKMSLSGLAIPKVVVPETSDWGDRFKYLRLENIPGEFPFTAGVFPLKRTEEDPKRMFAGEGGPARTNKRFHFLCEGEAAKRLSTAFDSVTLYGFEPDTRPDIFGKVGESGVSICNLDDMKTLYKGFDLIHPATSVSMTINGPAPMILAYFFNTAIDQQVELKTKVLGRSLTEAEYDILADETLQQVRGTVQADILKEDQGQNTCIFSTQFALKMMGDIQEYFVQKKIRNFYSVSISGYHIAEAGANPISQLAFTLSNGFTFVEYYKSRGMKIDDFAQNLSFFFSNGLDPEYSVLGRVARRIWSIAMRDLYGASERSQKLKYHIQTSGRSLHAQEIAFNDIRTTLQAFLAISDNCNSLHTNAYDEAITTPTEESVRRAMAIQLIINKEFGFSFNENPLQGSYFIERLTEMVEEAVLNEFLAINQRGGVLGAMETQYQRSKIQEESLYYERLKHSGELPLVGVNTFVDPKTLQTGFIPVKIELARASQEEKKAQLNSMLAFKKKHEAETTDAINNLKQACLSGQNIFAALMKASRYCTLGEMTQALFQVGGEYRRNV